MSDGEDNEEIAWPGMRVWNIQKTPRAKGLLARAAFVRGKQHDHYTYGPTGSPRDPGVGYIHERMAPAGFVPVVPKHLRQPQCPYPLGRITTKRFTDLLLGEGNKPTVTVPADPVTENYLEGFFDEARCWDTFADLRDKAGECGEAYLSIGVMNGTPVARAHNAWNIWVREWADGEQNVVVEVVEQKLVVETRLNTKTKKLEEVAVWETRVWDKEYEYVYESVPEDYGEEVDDEKVPAHVPGDEDKKNGWIPISKIYEHKAGRCPVLLHQNTRNTESTSGDPDAAGGHKLSDNIDKLQSGVVRSAGNNTDPTMAIADSAAMHRHYPWHRKGAGAVVRTSEKGKAYFLESTGEAVATGWKSVEQLRDQYLQVVRLIMIDPQTAGTYKSGEALKALWRSQNAATGKKRVPLTTTIRSAASIAIALGEQHEIGNLEAELPEQKGTEEPKAYIMLPPLVLEDAERRHYGVAKGDEPAVVSQRVGKGRFVKVKWPPFHEPTPTEIAQIVQAMTMGTGQKAVISQKSGVAVVSEELGLQPEVELARIEEEKEKNVRDFDATMFGKGDDDEEEADKKPKDKAEDEPKEEDDKG